MTDDLETALRAMLAERAQDVRSVPVELLTVDPAENEAADVAAVLDADGGEGEVIDLGLRLDGVLSTARRRWPVLVAAAAVLAAVGSVLALLVGGPTHHATPPVHHPHAPRTVTRTSCLTGIPAAWTRAAEHGTTVRGVDAGDVTAVTPSGGLVLQTDGPASTKYGTARFAYLAPGASSPRSLGVLRVPLPQGTSSGYEFDTDVDNATLLVTAYSGRRPRVVVAVDLHTGKHTTIVRTSPDSGRKLFDDAYVQAGIAYYQTDPRARTKGRALHDQVIAVPVTGGTRQLVGSGDVYLDKSALGIVWNNDEAGPERPADVPAVVSRHANLDSEVDEVFESYITDGHVYAWQTLGGALDWYDPTTNRLVTIPHLLGVPGVEPGQAALYSVAGPLVYFQDQKGDADRVVDVRTGAVVRVSQEGYLYGAHGSLIGDRSLLAPHAGGSALLRIHAADLPPAHC
ncbi:hypothetical protein [Jatrophihabitans endophyticus]|uniref:hypothetical protein n=1 Tax=Jatrophihabitans endophyticus TaxID=1206085 RepID=UPI001A0ED39F|nr:hypothetical protein [Jatrophihabitans endophyticus]MBE7187145.1 hypothetical protein [Jatrophihabitans endophyticus]